MAEKPVVRTDHIVEKTYSGPDKFLKFCCLEYIKYAQNENGNSEVLILYIVSAGLRTLKIDKKFTLNILNLIASEHHRIKLL